MHLQVWDKNSKSGWWWLEHDFYDFPDTLGMSSSQLTNSYFSEGFSQPPTSIDGFTPSSQILLFLKSHSAKVSRGDSHRFPTHPNHELSGGHVEGTRKKKEEHDGIVPKNVPEKNTVFFFGVDVWEQLVKKHILLFPNRSYCWIVDMASPNHMVQICPAKRCHGPMAPWPLSARGVYDMFRLPFVLPQSGEAPPGEEANVDLEGIKGRKGQGTWSIWSEDSRQNTITNIQLYTYFMYFYMGISWNIHFTWSIMVYLLLSPSYVDKIFFFHFFYIYI